MKRTIFGVGVSLVINLVIAGVSFATQGETVSYLIYKGGNTYYAKNGTTESIDYSGTNAATVINNALSNLTSGRTWKEKVLLKGDFVISANISIPSYTILEIDGKASLTNSANTSVITGTDKTQIEIRGGTIEGNRTNQSATSHGIHLTRPRECTIENVRIQNVRDVAIYINCPTSSGASNVQISDCLIDNAGKGIAFDGNIEKVRVEDTRVYGCGLGSGTGAVIFNAYEGFMYKIFLKNVEVYGPYGYGIAFDGSSGSTDVLTVTDCIVENIHDAGTAAFGFWFPNSAWDNAIKKFTNCVVRNYGTGNTNGDCFGLRGNNGTLVNCFAADAPGSGDGYAFGNTGLTGYRWAFIACYASNNPGQGFMLYRLMNSKLIGCLAHNNTNDGFYLRGCERVVLSGCEAFSNADGVSIRKDVEGSPSQSTRNQVDSGFYNSNSGTGIREYDSSDHNTVRNVHAVGNSTTQITLIGVNSVQSNNKTN